MSAVERSDQQVLADAFVSRMRWPSMHWTTQSLDYDAAMALALVALEAAPDIIATARLKEQAMTEALAAFKPVAS